MGAFDFRLFHLSDHGGIAESLHIGTPDLWFWSLDERSLLTLEAEYEYHTHEDGVSHNHDESEDLRFSGHGDIVGCRMFWCNVYTGVRSRINVLVDGNTTDVFAAGMTVAAVGAGFFVTRQPATEGQPESFVFYRMVKATDVTSVE
jgi:hypothetical protein